MLEEAEEIYFGYDTSTDNGYQALIKKLEMMCRMSPEYKVWSKDMKMEGEEFHFEYSCPICDIEYEYSRMETHHHPKTLYEIVDYEVQRLLQSNNLDAKIATPLEIATTVMKKHTDRHVDYVNLCKSCHEKFHDMHAETRIAVDKIFKGNKEKGRI